MASLLGSIGGHTLKKTGEGIGDRIRKDAELARQKALKHEDHRLAMLRQDDDQAHRTGEREAGEKFTRGESKLGREFQTGERLAGQQFSSGERIAGQKYESDRAFIDHQRTKDDFTVVEWFDPSTGTYNDKGTGVPAMQKNTRTGKLEAVDGVTGRYGLLSGSSSSTSGAGGLKGMKPSDVKDRATFIVGELEKLEPGSRKALEYRHELNSLEDYWDQVIGNGDPRVLRPEVFGNQDPVRRNTQDQQGEGMALFPGVQGLLGKAGNSGADPGPKTAAQAGSGQLPSAHRETAGDVPGVDVTKGGKQPPPSMKDQFMRDVGNPVAEGLSNIANWLKQQGVGAQEALEVQGALLALSDNPSRSELQLMLDTYPHLQKHPSVQELIHQFLNR